MAIPGVTVQATKTVVAAVLTAALIDHAVRHLDWGLARYVDKESMLGDGFTWVGIEALSKVAFYHAVPFVVWKFQSPRSNPVLSCCLLLSLLTLSLLWICICLGLVKFRWQV